MELKSNLKNKRRPTPLQGVTLVMLCIYCASVIILFLWSLVSSFRSHSDILENAFSLKGTWSIESWSNVFNKLAMAKWIDGEKHNVYFEEMFLNSVLYSVGSSFLMTFCTALMAYCTSKYKGTVSSIIYYTVLVTMIFPVVGNLASMLEVTQALHFYDSILGLCLMRFGFNNIYYFIFYAAFEKISWDYAEAAFIDGASHFAVFFKVMLPLVANLFGTVFILNFIGAWNDFETAYMFLPNHPTVSVVLYAVVVSGGSLVIHPDTPTQIATAFMVFLPILALFIGFKNKIMANLTEGGIKG